VHARSLTLQLYAYTGDLPAAQEIVQEAFCRALPRWHRIRRYDDPVAWLRRVAWNLATPTVAPPFTVSRGPLSSHLDPGRIPVILQPGHGASFALGTTLGDQDTYDVREVILIMPGDNNQLLVVMPFGFPAGTRQGHAIPFTVTGVTSGTAGPPQ